MTLSEGLEEVLGLDTPLAFEHFASVLDAKWIEEALETTGKISIRRRKLPSENAIWLVIGMSLFRDRSIQEVVSHLSLVLPESDGSSGTVATSAISKCRNRLGAEPLQAIFECTAEHWAEGAARSDQWRGLSVYASDGTTLRVQDSDENRSEFGAPAGKNGVGSYPQIRLVTLYAARSHLIRAAKFGPYLGKKTGELSLMSSLWPLIEDNSLTILDRGFLDLGMLYEFNAVGTNRHWLIRAKRNTHWKTIEEFADGDELVEIKFSYEAQNRRPGLPPTMIGRAIRYQHGNHPPQWLLTSLLDPTVYPAVEFVALYHERWEAELGYDEIKTHMLERQETLRSKIPERVRQEVWGMLTAYNLVRQKMYEAAVTSNIEPTRFSFRHSLQIIRIFCLVEAWTTAPSKLPRRLTELADTLSLLVLPTRRPERSYARVVKTKPKKYGKLAGRR